LQNDQYWSSYFTGIYGDVPSSGYPICPGAFQFLWKLKAAVTGVVQSDPADCAGGKDGTGMELDAGTYFTGSSFVEAQDVFAFIYNPNLYGVSVPANTWVEVQKTVFPGDSGASWYYMAVGSGVWINVGSTAVYKDHPDMVSDLLGQACSDQSQDKFGDHPTECENNFNDIYQAAISKGYNTIQVTDHYDCTCGPEGDSSWKYNRHCPTEIIALDKEDASNACSDMLKGGWEASADCNCDESFKSTTKDSSCADGCGYANCGAF
jgi:hypothetical protein